MHVRSVLGIVEEQQFAGFLVDLAMRRYAVERRPGGDAQIVQRIGVELISLAALVKGRDELSGMDHHVGRCAVLQAAVRAEAGAFGGLDRIGQPAP